jgi:tetratricopeptide (TPR) repeat protein
MAVLSPARPTRIFFSYAISSPEDKVWFDQLTKHLSILRYSYPTYEWYDSKISSGDPIDQFIEARLNQADLIVLLTSADFFASRRCYELEMQRAIARSDAGEARLIPVLLRPTNWHSSPLARYSPLPANGLPVSSWSDSDAALVEIVQGIHQVIKELTIQGTTHINLMPQQVPIYNLPYISNDFFTDRDAILATISSFFATRSRRTLVFALNGLGGVGKTHIALEYSYRSSHDYQSVFWLNASSRTMLGTEIRTLARQLPLSHKDWEDEAELFDTIKLWLQGQSNWLLVLDQLQDMTLLDLIVPLYSSGHVLLTTRIQATGRRASAMSVPSMDIDASTLFLLQRAKLLPAEAQLQQAPTHLVREAVAIAHALDGFPLALDQAGAYIEEKGCNLSTYLHLYQKQRAQLLSERGRLADDHRESVMSTLLLTFEQVTHKNDTNLDLLRLLAFLHPDAIPEGLILNGAQVLSEPLRTLAANPLTLHQAFADLLSFSLLHHGADRTLLQIHRIVQDILIDLLTTTQRRSWARQAVRLVNEVFPEVHFDTWTECERYLPQAQHCSRLMSRFHLTLIEGAQLLERLGTYCSRRASYIEAETYLREALNLYEQHIHTDPLTIAQTLNALGLLYEKQAQYQEAKVHHQRALELREHLLGPDDPKTAESLHNLAIVYGDLGEYQKAEQLYLRVLQVEESMKGLDHSDVAITLNNLGLTYSQQGRYAEAETMYQRALTIYEQATSAEHPDLTYTLNGLGALAEKRGDYQRAQELYQRSLTIRTHIFGEQHPEIAQNLNKLASIAEAQGNYQQAEIFYQQGLAICEDTLRPHHPDIALFLNNLAFLANKQGQYQQAEPLYLRALNIFEQALGTQHPTVASVLNNLGQLYRKIGNEERAEEFLRQALAIRQKTLGPTHPYIAQSLSNLADLLTSQHRYEEAEPLFQQALTMLLQTFGPEQRDVIRVREQYISLLEEMQRSEEAATLRQTTQGQSPSESSQNTH